MATVVDAIFVTLGLDTSKYTTQAENAIKTDARLEKSLDGVEKKGGAVSKNFEGLAKAVKGAAKVFASLAAATGIIRFLQNVAEETRQANEEMLKLQASLGLTAEKINGMRGAGAALGGTAEGMTNSMKGLNKGMNDFVVKGDTSLLPFMNALGVSMVDGQGKLRDVDKVMLDLSDSFSKMNSEQAYALGQDMGFDEGTIAALMQGRDAMKEMSEYHAKMYTSSKEELAASRELSKNQAQLSAHWASMKLMIGNAIIPLLVKLTNFAKAFFEFLQDHQKTVKNVFEAMAFVLGAVLIPLFGKALFAALAFIAPFAPFILVVTAIAAAFVLLYDDYKVWAEGGQSLFDWGKFSDLIDGAKLSVESLTKGFGELADKVMAEVIPTLKGYASIIQKLFSGDFAGASAEAKEMFAEFGSRAKDAISPAWNKAADFMLGGAFKIGDNQSPAVGGGFTGTGGASALRQLIKAEGTKRVYELANGQTETRTGGTVAWRNNNPGNLKFEYAGSADKTVKSKRSKEKALSDAQKRYKGIIALDQWGNAVFETMEAGAVAKAKLLKSQHGNKTYQQMLRGYAKSDYSGTTNYGAYEATIKKTATSMGVNLEGKTIGQMTDAEFKALAQGMVNAEGVKQGQSVVSGAAQAQGMVQQSATPRKLYNSKGLQSDMQSRSVDVKMGDLNIYTTASSVSGITSDAMRGVEASLNNLGTSMA